MADEAPPPPPPSHWVGRKPAVEGLVCNKPTGICGYLNCAKEGRCLQTPTKPNASQEK
jgi:hypothetical protein